MKIIEPSVKLIKCNNTIEHVARCARVCYKKDKGNDKRLFIHLLNNKHLSVFRHVSIYAIIPRNKITNEFHIQFLIASPYTDCRIVGNKIYLSTNKNFIYDLQTIDFELYRIIGDNVVSTEVFENDETGFNMLRYTFEVITQISTSRELNRVSPNNITEQSTRYVYEDGTICRPHWMSIEDADYLNNGIIFENWISNHLKEYTYYQTCNSDFINYKALIERYGMHRQDARGVLPIDTATKCIYTYTIDEWRHILDLRYYGTTGKPHPNAKIITGMIKDKLAKQGYDFK